jgi:peptidyl-prolyl cis-trans isomerase A (cyclophilin A)
MSVFVRWARAGAFVVGLMACGLLGAAERETSQHHHPQIEIETSRGSFVVEVYPEKAPRTVENFMQYVNSGFYTGTVFHRAVQRFLVQGGGLTESLEAKPTLPPIPNESTNGLSNMRGTVAMARGGAADSATSQFFINLADNRFLNFYRPEAGLEGYTVFGRVIRGLDVLLAISNGTTTTIGKFSNVPTEPPVIRSARVLENPIIAENELPVIEPEAKEKKSTLVKKGKKRGKT